jgi:uncharacterized protein HemX
MLSLLLMLPLLLWMSCTCQATGTQASLASDELSRKAAEELAAAARKLTQLDASLKSRDKEVERLQRALAASQAEAEELKVSAGWLRVKAEGKGWLRALHGCHLLACLNNGGVMWVGQLATGGICEQR